MTDFKFDPRRTALLNIDMQNCFVENSPVAAPRAREILPRINKIAEVCRKRGTLVIHTLHVVRPDGSNTGVMGAIIPAVAAGLINKGNKQAELHPEIMLTFTVGAALSGLAGGVMAPLTGLLPSVGGAYIAKAFITVITGGAAVIAGTLSTAALFGTVDQLVSFASTPVVGEIAMLVFGSESSGLPPEILQKYAAQAVRVPMRPEVRSLNLSATVAAAAYEAVRQIQPPIT